MEKLAYVFFCCPILNLQETNICFYFPLMQTGINFIEYRKITKPYSPTFEKTASLIASV